MKTLIDTDVLSEARKQMRSLPGAPGEFAAFSNLCSIRVNLR